jgi:hypothetical protein
LLAKFRKGEEFNVANRPRYAYNEVEVRAPDGKKFRVDSYDPSRCNRGR